jgi:hypothetical protein
MSFPAAHSSTTSTSTQQQQPPSTVQRLLIPVHNDGKVKAFLHLPASYPKSNDTSSQNETQPQHQPDPHPVVNAAAILLSGSGGGVVGPSSMYLSIGAKLSNLRRGCGIPVLRMDYRYPAQTDPCVTDVLSAMDWLESEYAIRRFVLVG